MITRLFVILIILGISDMMLVVSLLQKQNYMERIQSRLGVGDVALPLPSSELVRSPDQVWDSLSNKGKALSMSSKRKLFHRSLITGFFISVGGIVTASVGLDTGVNPFLPGHGLDRLIMGSIGFPSAFYALKIFGSDSLTNDVFCSTLSFLNGCTSLDRVFLITIDNLIGSLIGVTTITVMMQFTGIPALRTVLLAANSKLVKTPMEIFIRGILGGWLMTLSSYLADASTTMAGKMLGIWLAISTYVMCDFEHFLATFFFLLSGMLNGSKASLFKVFKIMFISLIGNVVGAVTMAIVGYLKIGCKEPFFTARSKLKS